MKRIAITVLYEMHWQCHYCHASLKERRATTRRIWQAKRVMLVCSLVKTAFFLFRAFYFTDADFVLKYNIVIVKIHIGTQLNKISLYLLIYYLRRIHVMAYLYTYVSKIEGRVDYAHLYRVQAGRDKNLVFRRGDV